MGLMSGKKGIIFGVSNKRGIGYGEWPEFVVRDAKQLKYAAVIKYKRVYGESAK